MCRQVGFESLQLPTGAILADCYRLSRSVKAFAARATASLARLDVFVENAGVAYMTGWHPLPSGVETMLQVNDISTGLLGVLLLPLLAKTAALPLEPGQKPFKPHLTLVGSRSEIF